MGNGDCSGYCRGCIAILSIIIPNHTKSKERRVYVNKSKTLQDARFERVELKLEEQNKNLINITKGFEGRIIALEKISSYLVGELITKKGE